jgi:diguanylate cyclase (GGDEF)-like protein
MDKDFYNRFKANLNKVLKRSPKELDISMVRKLKQDFDKLYHLTVIEEKTHLYNHRYFSMEFRKEIERAARYNRQLSLLLLDLDNFKQVNDIFGHDKGDEVLKKVAQLIKANLRMGDFPARFGGEEFIVMLPETDSKKAFRVAEKLRIAILSDPTLGYYDVSTSIGVVTLNGKNLNGTFRDNVKATPHDLFKKVDRALMWAKRHGKNQTKIWDKSLDS